MELNILGTRVSLESLILIGVLYIILCLHTVCPCMNMPLLYESLTNMSASSSSSKPAMVPTAMGTGGKKKEGFSSAGVSSYTLSDASPYKLGDMTPINTSSWMGQDLVVRAGQPLPSDVKKILDRPEQPVPLPEGELLMFANNKFTPGACSSSYSSSTGCVDMTVGQYNYLVERGGNNVPYSEY